MVTPGVRVSLTGRASEERVLGNIDRLQARGARPGIIVVLAKHTRKRLIEVYEFLASREMSFRILPLFSGPAERTVDSFALSDDDIVASMNTLFEHWMETGVRVRVAPFVDNFETVLRKLLGIEGPMFDRRQHGDTVLVVNVDGHLYRILDLYEPHLSMGNVSDESMEEILSSPRYARSLERDDQRIKLFCGGCEYAGACNGWPVFATDQSGSFQGRCPITYRIYLFMEEYLKRHGFTESELGDMWAEIAQSMALGRSEGLARKLAPIAPI